MPAPANLTYTLPADAQYHLIRSVAAILPPPPDPSPDAEARRNNAIIARVAALRPFDSAEADLASTFVLAIELQRDAIRLSRDPDMPLPMKLKCRNQAASMMRQAASAMRELRHLRAERRATQSDPEAADQGERAEHIATVLLAEGLTNPPPPARLTAEPAHDPEPPVSPYDPEPHQTKTETSARHPQPAVAAQADHTQLPVSHYDPEPQHTKTETSARHPLSVTTRPAQPTEAAPADRTQPPVSRHDPRTRKHKIETTARRPNPPESAPPAAEPELVGAWRLAHLFPAAPDDLE